MSKTNSPLVIFSHLRWEFVTQRPQHLANLLSEEVPILFVEEAIAASTEFPSGARVFQPHKKITVIQPIIGDQPYEATVGKYLRRYFRKHNWESALLWFYSPMFIDMVEEIPSHGIIYDCMDELSLFKGAPASLLAKEKQLLAQADLVFTGGVSLYEAKREVHPNAHCFPSSVDRKHFENALSITTQVPKDLAHIPGPRVGFYGVIDERLDLKLMDAIALANPKLSFVYIGPVVKIDERDLPRRANIHYLGGKSYDELPAYLKGFTITMMPFALNEATKFISPTKTLEYMAAQKPIVSTAIKDVANVYTAGEVAIAHSAAEFSKALESYLTETPAAKKQRLKMQKRIIKETSWTTTAARMWSLMQQLQPNELDTATDTELTILNPAFVPAFSASR